MTHTSEQIKVRFPPSPTGLCHVGTARMALLNTLFARKNAGTIVFRSEDTDRERSKKEFEDDIIESLTWLGLSYDSFFRQSERTAIYTAAIQKLIDEGKAYLSEEESKKDAGVMVQLVRLKNPGKTVTFADIIRGDITFDTTELGDFAIARALDDPLYHLAVVIDDADMGITHVIRGEEHISNTPRQILIQEALGYPRPQYAHYPLFLGADRAKLSKRMGDVSVREYRNQGYLPEALLNFVGTLGWTPPSGKEILSLAEMIEEFDLADLHKSGAVFDITKLRWYNREYLQQLSAEEFERYIAPTLQTALEARNLQYNDLMVQKILPILRERIHISSDIGEMVAEGELDFFFAEPKPESARIPEKKSNAADAARHLQHAHDTLIGLSDWNEQAIKDALWDYATEHGRGAVLWPLRYALSARDKSPDPFAIAAIIGKEATLSRINYAIGVLRI
ncbi:MAG TPA: glutamate--tRNA ligase [Candidatus Paceibacterota bacterium]|nr:glutamate--tRNA ligase [Candidatus Paceibacterota bacterium]